ncbi:MAG TPA: hypothetical protein VHD90_09890 [Phototrophicaceae bacterium]|nr:hypothetical protein [Phototrophicaceae bacterium]
MRWGGSAEIMLRRGRSWLALTCVALFSIWLLVLLIGGGGFDSENPSLIIMFLCFGASFMAGLALDFTCMAAAIGGVGREIVSGRWDLLRLTLLRLDQVVAAKHGAAQTHAWRWMALLIGTRLAISLMLLVTVLITFFQEHPFGLAELAASPALLTQYLALFLVIVLLGLVFSVEPFWRMRAVTALGVAISTRTQQHAVGVLAALAAIMAIWLAQGFIILTIFMFASFLLAPLALAELSTLQVAVCSPWLLLGMFAGVVYGFYNIIQTWSLRSAERWLAQLK